jgi:hypothetical protein
MKIATSQLVAELNKSINGHIQYAESLLQIPEEKLNYRTHPESWSALECLQHLNLYGDFYLPEIDRRINQSKTKPEPVFKSGILGNYFANSMLPKEKLNKMKTFQDKNPSGSTLDKRTIEEFIRQQNELLSLLDRAKKISLNKVRNSITISNIIKLKLGDTFRFLVNHNERHIRQAKRAINN